MLFYKMNGLGNDYVFIDTAVQLVDKPEELARALSNRNFSVGSDGLVLISPSTDADVKMEIFNKDGSRAEMCGNAVRCVVRYLHDVLHLRHNVYHISTDSGSRSVRVEEDENGSFLFAEVDMGMPIFQKEVQLLSDKIIYLFDSITVGNPHAVTFLDILPEDVSIVGKRFSEDTEAFPAGANVEFCKVRNLHELEVNVYERGSGVTLSCGTGATAAAFAAIRRGLCKSPVTVNLPGGTLTISTDKERYYMKGTAEINYKGEL